VLRTSIDPASVTSALRKAVSEVDANVPLDQIETMRQIVSGSVAQSRFRTALLGICIGLVGAALLARLIASLLFGVAPFDRATIASVSVLLVVVALVACYIPAQRAAKADPMDSLRYE
jgi:ABC-type lipoprotein release transport system permease subunit